MMRSINIQGRLMSFAEPKVMGILNVTEDSFYDGSKYNSVDSAIRQTQKMLSEGADLIDIGAASSRPGAKMKSSNEEWGELRPILSEIINQFPSAVVSIDTYHASVAEKSIELGAHIINDISAGDLDERMLDFIAEVQVPYIMMHMKGNPVNMQSAPNYEDVTSEVLKYFLKKIRKLRNRGLKDIIIDPGFGFGKTLAHNYTLLNKLEVFKLLDCPILAGVSRKSMIYKLLNIYPSESLSATSALNLQSLMNGADILRVHDVKEAKEVIQLYKMLTKSN